jgi:hypothetical protein
MTVDEAILFLRQSLNKDITNRNVNIDKPRGVLILRQAISEYCHYIIYNERNTDNLDIVSVLLKQETISKTKSKGETKFFELPKDLIRVESAVGIGSKGGCESKIALLPTKNRNRSLSNNNDNLKADWMFREAYYNLGEGSLKIDSDFEIGRVEIEYYREPNKIDTEGYIDAITGQPSKNVPFEFPDHVIFKIINLAIKNFATLNQINT